MRLPKAGEIWIDAKKGPAWSKVKVAEVLGNFISYAEMAEGYEAARLCPGFVDEFVQRYAPPPLQLPDAQAILPLAATGFRPATFNMGAWSDDEVIALIKVTVQDSIVSVEVEEPDA